MPKLFLLVLLTVTSYGWKLTCDATNETTCYVTLGKPAHVQLVATNSTFQITLLKGNETVFIFRRSKLRFHLFDETIRQRWLFNPFNGTLIITPAEKRDLGTYRVQIYKQNTGTLISDHSIQLTTKASPPTLSTLCFNGERRVVCLSEEHNPQYSWSLAEGSKSRELDLDLSAVSGNTLSVRTEVPLTVICTIKTHGGILNVSQTIAPCPGLIRSVAWNWGSANGSKAMKIWVNVEDAPLHLTDDDVRSILRTPCSTGISPVFISVWLAEIITFTALLVGGYYLHITKSKPVMAAGCRNQELKLKVLQEDPLEE